MRTKQVGKATIILIIVLLGAGAYITGHVPLRQANIAGTLGFAVESITTSKIISNDADLESANLIVTVTANGDGQSVVGDFGTGDFKQYLPNLIVQYPLKIEMGGISETLTYPIRNEGGLYKYEYEFSPTVNWASDAKCLSGYEYCYLNIAGSVWWGNTYRTINVRKVPAGSYGKLDNPNINWKGQVTTTINGIPFTKTIGSAESAGAVDFHSATGEWIANVRWLGSLVTGQATPNPNVYITTFTNGKWKVADIKYYSDYTSSLTLIKTTFDTWKSYNSGCTDSPCADVVNAVNNHNAVVDILTSQDTKVTYTAATGETLQHTTEGGIDNGFIVESTNRRVTNPRLTFLVKASKLGVLIPVGKPEIISITASPFSSGDSNGAGAVTFKNVGSASGTFAATFTDNSGTFYPSSNVESSKATAGAGETKTIQVFIGHGASSEAIKTARMRVYDVNKPSNYDEKDFTITMTAPKKCVPGSTRTDGGIVYTCKPDGMGEEITLNCADGIISYSNGKYSCQKTGTATVTPPVTPPPGTNQTKKSAGTVLNWYETPQAGILATLIVLTAAVGLIRFRRRK